MNVKPIFHIHLPQAITALLLLATLLPVHATWIEPPLRTEKGYPVPQPDVMPDIPAAHGAHREYAIEWWYWIGHLESPDGREHFGFQSTVFRLAGDPEKAGGKEEGNPLGNRQLFMSHAALTDVRRKTFYHSERIYREGWQAEAEVGRLGLRVGPIRATELPDGTGFRLETNYENDGQLRLELRPTKPLIRFGERGLSRKGADPAAVSWYWTYTRMEAKGALIRNGREIPLQGTVWMDHEISSSQLGSDLEGWDWTCMKLDDGTEVKAYRLRRKDGTSDPWSKVYWIDRDAGVRSVYADQFSWEENSFWTSPETGLSYPTRVTVRATDPRDGRERAYTLRPLVENQEFIGNDGGNPYWEGACEVLNERGEKIGIAYLELAGFGGDLSTRLN